MQYWLRATLLTLCAAIGVAVALALGLVSPPPKSELADAVASKPKLAARLTAVPEQSPPAAIIPAPQEPGPLPAPAVAPHRDSFVRQVGHLEESLQELEE